MAELYISDIVKAGDIKSNVFNLIDAGCGSGKTYFCVNRLFDVIPDLSPEQVVVITSRSITATQMEQNDITDVTRVMAHEFNDDGIDKMIDKGIMVMTYDAAPKYLMMINSCVSISYPKVIVVDECHTLFTDKFIKDIGYVVAMINLMIMSGNVYVIGLTATSGIIHRYGDDVFKRINDVCGKIPTRYPAENLVVTRMKYVPGYLKNASGKTIIIVPYAKHAAYLNNLITNSAVVVSKSRHGDIDDVPYERYMDDIRNCIIQDRALPEVITTRNRITNTYETHRLDVLIATTTFREGFNLDEISGVENVVCCFADDINITQFLGRCRYAVKNLIIAPPDNMTFNQQYGEYFKEQFDAYNSMFDGYDSRWLDVVKDLVSCDVYDFNLFTCELEHESPDNFIDSIDKYVDCGYIYNDGMKDIVEIAKEFCVLPGVKKIRYVKKNVIEYMNNIGYDVQVIKDDAKHEKTKYMITKKVAIDNKTLTLPHN